MKRSVYLFIVVVVMAASAALSALNLSASSVDAAVDAAAGAAENSASSYIAASTAIKAYYNQYPSYFGTASGSVNTITDGSGTWYYQWYVSGAAIRAIVAYSDGSLYWLDGANWHNTGQSWLPSTDINNATTAIKAFYKQYMAYFGTASGVVTKYTDGSGTWYYQWYTKGAAIIAYSDGNLYWIDGRSWHATGQSWQPATDLSNATSAISSFYNQYPSYFGISSGVVTSYIDSTGTWYYQWFSKGTAIIAYSDGNLYWFDGRSWNATGQSWQPSTDLSNATSAIQSFYNQYPAVFGGASGSVGSNIDGNGIYYFQLYANGTAIIAYSDGNLYWSNGFTWYNAGQSWQPSSNQSTATSAIQSFYNLYPAYFGIISASVASYTDATGTWYFQQYANGKSIIAYSDGNVYFSDGINWYSTGTSWQTSTTLSAATSAISSFYSQYPSYFGIVTGGVNTYTDASGTWYYQLYYNGTAIIAYTDGNLYFSDGANWYNTGVTWQGSSGGNNKARRPARAK